MSTDLERIGEKARTCQQRFRIGQIHRFKVGHFCGLRGVVSFRVSGRKSCLTAVSQAVALTSDVNGGRVVEQSIEQARRFRARKTFFVDMTHDVDHESTNVQLAQLADTDGLDVQLAYDGLKLDVDLP